MVFMKGIKIQIYVAGSYIEDLRVWIAYLNFIISSSTSFRYLFNLLYTCLLIVNSCKYS